MVDYQYVDDAAGFSRMQRRLSESGRFAVDIESDSYHHYREKIALIQICEGDINYILDPLGMDLEPLASLLEDPSKEKVFHDVDYDGRMILTNLGVKPTPVFDTMIAARILGKEKVGLADLLGGYFGVDVDKRLQRANWSHRPLSLEMLHYAALDVAYLLPLRDRLAMEIEGLGRMEWAREEFSRLVNNLEAMPERQVSALKVKGTRDLSARQLAVLQKLLEWRERKAAGMDVPSFKVVGTERLIRLARHQPHGRRDLERSKILSPRQAARFGNEILAALEAGMKVPQSKCPRFPKPPRQRRDLVAEKILKGLKKVRDERAGELGMDPGFLMSNAVLKAVAREKPQGLAEMRKSGLLKEWQLKVMGEHLVQVIADTQKPRL
jgi:ribonuclease D